MATYVAPNLSRLVLEIAQDVAGKERALATPLSQISIATDYQTSRVTVSGSFALVSAAGTNGTLALTASNYINDGDAVVVAGTPIATLTPSNPVAALMAAVERLEQAEQTKVATGVALPAGTGTSWSASEADTFEFTCILPSAVSYDAASGKLSFVPTDYTA
jgi:hypothetical protein